MKPKRMLSEIWFCRKMVKVLWTDKDSERMKKRGIVLICTEHGQKRPLMKEREREREKVRDRERGERLRM